MGETTSYSFCLLCSKFKRGEQVVPPWGWFRNAPLLHSSQPGEASYSLRVANDRCRTREEPEKVCYLCLVQNSNGKVPNTWGLKTWSSRLNDNGSLSLLYLLFDGTACAVSNPVANLSRDNPFSVSNCRTDGGCKPMRMWMCRKIFTHPIFNQ